MVTTGRSTLGSSRTSTPRSAANPASTISRFITTARTGRRTLRDGKSPRSGAPGIVGGTDGDDGVSARSATDSPFHRCLLGQDTDGFAFSHALDAFDDNGIALDQRRLYQHGILCSFPDTDAHLFLTRQT